MSSPSKNFTSLDEAMKFSDATFCSTVIKQIFASLGSGSSKEELLANNTKSLLQERDCDGRTILLRAAGVCQAPTENFKTLLDEIVRICGTSFLKDRLVVDTDGNKNTVLNLICALPPHLQPGNMAAFFSALDRIIKNCTTPVNNADSSDDNDDELARLVFLPKNEKENNCLVTLWHYGSPSHITIETLILKVIEYGNLKILQQLFLDGRSPVFFPFTNLLRIFCPLYFAPPTCLLMCGILYRVGLFEEHYRNLSDNQKDEMRQKFQIDSEKWRPERNYLAEFKARIV